ncbi:helix-turn-helix domain-containing protein [Spartinivicinus ruber]|uniref:helix-turn-helix domain-containing protein n=1 Tax=Spartinivicinus ruber TaxID=2683272 RepID=UPI0022A76B21|nr:helix-turn-helix domain-containing protein [Spartinivicinus ruber]
MSNKKSELKDRIRTLRQSHKMSQEELSRKLGITKAAISAWETGRNVPTSLVIKELSELFGCPVEWIESDTTEINDELLVLDIEKQSEFKDRLKAVRKFRLFTQEELANKLGVSTAAVASWEIGRSKPKEASLRQICKTLDCPYDWLSSDSSDLDPSWKERVDNEPPDKVDDANQFRSRILDDATEASVTITRLALEEKLTQSDLKMILALLKTIEDRP